MIKSQFSVKLKFIDKMKHTEYRELKKRTRQWSLAPSSVRRLLDDKVLSQHIKTIETKEGAESIEILLVSAGGDLDKALSVPPVPKDGVNEYRYRLFVFRKNEDVFIYKGDTKGFYTEDI